MCQNGVSHTPHIFRFRGVVSRKKKSIFNCVLHQPHVVLSLGVFWWVIIVSCTGFSLGVVSFMVCLISCKADMVTSLFFFIFPFFGYLNLVSIWLTHVYWLNVIWIHFNVRLALEHLMELFPDSFSAQVPGMIYKVFFYVWL